MKPKIGIIGDGNVGSALRRGLERAGYDVRAVGKDPNQVKQPDRLAAAGPSRVRESSQASSSIRLAPELISRSNRTADHVVDVRPTSRTMLIFDTANLLSQRCVAKDVANPTREIAPANISVEGVRRLRRDQSYELAKRPSTGTRWLATLREHEFAHRGDGHIQVLFSMSHVRREAGSQSEDGKCGAALLRERQDCRRSDGQLRHSRPAHVGLCAPRCQRGQFPLIGKTCDHNGFDHLGPRRGSYGESHTRVATTNASTPVRKVGWMTGANFGL